MRAFEWEYCECGCKGYETNVAGRHFWLYWDLGKSYMLYEGHGWTAQHLRTLKSFGAADRHVVALVKKPLLEQRAKINKVLRRIKRASK